MDDAIELRCKSVRRGHIPQQVMVRTLMREAVQSKRDVLQAQIEVARSDLKRLEDSRLVNVDEFRRKALAAKVREQE